MKKEYVAVIALLGISSCFLHADAQDIIFPGESERPDRFPLNPNNNNVQRPTQNPNSNNNGQGQNSGIITQEQYNTCVDRCGITSEYNPQCGSDGVTYTNPGALNCAINCGNPIQNLGRAPCGNVLATTPAPNSRVIKLQID